MPIRTIPKSERTLERINARIAEDHTTAAPVFRKGDVIVISDDQWNDTPREVRTIFVKMVNLHGITYRVDASPGLGGPFIERDAP